MSGEDTIQALKKKSYDDDNDPIISIIIIKFIHKQHKNKKTKERVVALREKRKTNNMKKKI